jgi:hypothetical protein
LRFISPIWELEQSRQSVDDERFLENKKQLLEKILVTKHSSCRFIVTSTSDVFATEEEIAARESLAPAIASTCKTCSSLLPQETQTSHRIPVLYGRRTHQLFIHAFSLRDVNNYNFYINYMYKRHLKLIFHFHNGILSNCRAAKRLSKGMKIDVTRKTAELGC